MSCLSFSVSHSSFYFRSFCPVAFSFSGCFLNRLLCFYFRFHGGGLCYYAITSRRYAPLALLATLKNAYSPCPLRTVFCLSCVVDVDLSVIVSSLPSLFRFRLGHRLFFILSSCGRRRRQQQQQQRKRDGRIPFNVSHQFPWWLIPAGKVPNIKNSSRRLPWRICTRV